MDWSVYIAWALCLIMGNVLDSVSTYVALNKLPVNLRATESNPLMGGFFKHHKVILATVIKHGIMLGIVVYYAIFSPNVYPIQLCTILIWLVVLSNLYILFGRIITRKKIKSPLHKVCEFLNVPEKWHFLAIIAILLIVSFTISRFALGV